MFDLHCHILPQIDDGAKNIKESIALLKEAKSAGFDAVFATPHYIENSIEETVEKKKFLIKELRQKANEENININIYCGDEVYISPMTDKILFDKKINTLNDTKYVLLELPMNSTIQYLDDVLFRIMCLKYIPIIAHPERYGYIQENPNLLVELVNKGVYCQMNYGSIIGLYGKTAQKTAKILLKCNMIHFLGTDTHRAGTIYPKIKYAISKLQKIINKDIIEKLTTENPKAVIEDKEIEITPPILYKKKLFGLF